MSSEANPIDTATLTELIEREHKEAGHVSQ